jgi:hypothetical protein
MNPLTIKFLNEPFWRWIVFFIALGLVLGAWKGIVSEMS